jgi:D-alanyl-D-alanine carboxypeptidase/D-alanyl-D-alanine-endopeptidase (penicillin-binding protein 4)|tara:strand:- start:1306 stop:2709 length:1404 start_codon:yes stop_codon:yes gene_type:complete
LTKIKLLFFTALYVAFSCAPHPALFNNMGNYALKKSINSFIIDSDLDVNMSIKVTSLNSGEIIYSLNSGKKLMPASNNKLYTCAASIVNLGPDFTFETSIYRNNKNLYLRGGGDPDFSLEHLDSLAKIAAGNIKSVDTLFVDESLMDTLHYGEGWMWDEGPWWYAAPVSALSLDDNCIDFFVHPNRVGKTVSISTKPKTDFIQIDNQSITVNDTVDFKKFKVVRDWAGRTNKFIVTGEKLINESADTLVRNIVHPPLFAGTVLKEMLMKYGITVNQISIGATPEIAEKVTSHISDSLFYSAKNLMNESDNLTAELFMKTMGIDEENPGNWEDGIKKVRSFLADSAGIDTSDIRIADGSGVSRYNLTSADHFIQLLTYLYHSPYKDNFIDVLPGGGSKGGTLEKRFKTTGSNIRAKTGSLSGVSCLSGYAFSPKYGPLAFSILMNGYVGSSKEYHRLQDRILEVLIYD